MADIDFPPFDPDATPAPLSPTTPYNPPMVGEASPFEPVHANNRDLILESIRAWSRGSLLKWTTKWQEYLTGWVSESATWLNGFNTAVQNYVTTTLEAQAEANTEALDAALETVSDAVDEITDTAVSKTVVVHVISCDGQSNMSGRGAPYGNAVAPGVDAAQARIFQYSRATGTNVLSAATEPLAMPDSPTGIGPALQFARNWIADLPDNDIIVLVDNAVGSSPLSTNDVLGWRWGVANNLSAKAVALVQSALTAAAAQWPLATVKLDGVLWFQGETDGTNSVPLTTYRTDLDALIAGYRSTYGISDLPFIVFSMIPEAIAASAARAAIATVHRDTPYRVANTGFVENNATGLNMDTLHANAVAHRTIYGPGAYAEFRRVKGKRAPVTAREVTPVPSPYVTVIASDGFTRADGPAVETQSGGLPYNTVSSDGTSHPVFGVVSQMGKFTSGIGATLSLQHYWWCDPGSISGQQRNLSVYSIVANNPGVAVQLDPTAPATNRILLTRRAADSAFWRIVRNNASATAEILDTEIPMTGALQKVTAERFDTYWRIWIDNVYAGRVSVLTSGTAFGGYVGTSTSAGTPVGLLPVWDGLQLLTI